VTRCVPRFGAVLLTLAVSGCDTPARDLEWVVSFADPAVASQATGIDAQVIVGGCSSDAIVFETSFGLDEIGPMPPVLSPGNYGFAVTARNDRCETIAEGCTPITLPLEDGSLVETVLVESATAATCDSGYECTDGRCVMPMNPDASLGDACAPDTSACRRIEPSNVTRPAMPSMAVILSSPISYDTTTCPFAPFGASVSLMQADGSDVCVVIVDDLTVEAGSTVTVRGDRPLIILADGSVVIDGNIDVSAEGDTPGPGGWAGGRAEGGFGGSGSGPFPGGTGGLSGEFGDGGGGGGGLCGSGGDGGRGGAAPGGGGGGNDSATELVPLSGGSGGGGSARGVGSTGTTGGAGGGAIQITAQGAITVSGAIVAGGGGGQGAAGAGGTNSGAGAGAGSGGAILLEARSIVFVGTGALGASGGGGGGGAGTDGEPGESGATGGANDALGGMAGMGSDGDGGDGGGRDALDGDMGADDRSVAPGSESNGGGGGGGAGCILLRTFDGALPAGAERSTPPPGPGLRAGFVRLE